MIIFKDACFIKVKKKAKKVVTKKFMIVQRF